MCFLTTMSSISTPRVALLSARHLLMARSPRVTTATSSSNDLLMVLRNNASESLVNLFSAVGAECVAAGDMMPDEHYPKENSKGQLKGAQNPKNAGE